MTDSLGCYFPSVYSSLFLSLFPHPRLLLLFLRILRSLWMPFSNCSEHSLYMRGLKSTSSLTWHSTWKGLCPSPLCLNGASSERISLISLCKTGPLVPGNIGMILPTYTKTLCHLTIFDLERKSWQIIIMPLEHGTIRFEPFQSRGNFYKLQDKGTKNSSIKFF